MGHYRLDPYLLVLSYEEKGKGGGIGIGEMVRGGGEYYFKKGIRNALNVFFISFIDINNLNLLNCQQI